MTQRALLTLAMLVGLTAITIWFIRYPKQSSPATSSDTIMVGTNAEFPPFTFIDNDRIVGFDIDVIEEIARRLHKKIILTNMSFEALIPELQLGNMQVIAAGMTPTPERAQRVFFTRPHFSGDPLLVIQRRGATPIVKVEQLKNKIVVVNQGYSADHYLTNQGITNIVRLSSPLISTGLLALKSGQADVFVAAKSSLQPFFTNQADNYIISPIANTAESSALAVAKKYPALFTAIENTLSAMINDGTIATLQKKWNLHD